MTTLEIILGVCGVGAVLFLLAWALVRGGSGKSYEHRSPVVKDPPLPPPLPTSNPSPELSCFARGLIKSMETEPEKWTTSCIGLWGDDWAYTAIHSESLVCLRYAEDDKQWISANVNLTGKEERAVAEALHIHVVEREARLAREREDAEEAERRKYFEQLGCPPKNAEETSQ